jgi:hypothetical protein
MSRNQSYTSSQGNIEQRTAKEAPSFTLHKGYISKGGDLLWQTMTVQDAKSKAARLPDCKGFCFKGADTGGPVEICFKNKWDVTNAGEWSSYRVERGFRKVEVQRLSASIGGRGWRYHDRRAVEVSCGELRIFEKGSTSKVKLVVDVASGVEDCSLMPGAVVSIVLNRPPHGADEGDGVMECKRYVFEFPTARTAANFHREVHRLLERIGD